VDAELNGPRVSETSRFGDLHTKTYDIELLISGALVFGLSSAPGEIDRLFDRWGPRLDGVASPALTYLYLYAQMIVYSMLATFVAHLLLRGYWIALLGLESVWSDGWKWELLKIGPFSKAHVQQRVTSLSHAINKADDRASVIFAAGAMLVMVSLHSLVIVLVTIAVAWLLAAATGIDGARAFFIVISVGFVAMVIIPMLDKRLGRRFDPASRSGRIFGRVIDAGMFLSPMKWTAPVQFVFQTRIGERKLSMAMAAAAGVLATVLVVGMLFRNERLRIDGWRYFDPQPAAATIDPRHYRDSGVARDGRRPTIDSDVISTPLIRLYLPYRPRRHNPMIASGCPDLASSVAQGRVPDNAAAATCLGGLYNVALDGVTIAPSYNFTRDAASDFVGVLAYIQTASLQPGPHEFTVDAPGNDVDASREITRIPFYIAGR
jgi:hypothetical protein